MRLPGRKRPRVAAWRARLCCAGLVAALMASADRAVAEDPPPSSPSPTQGPSYRQAAAQEAADYRPSQATPPASPEAPTPAGPRTAPAAQSGRIDRIRAAVKDALATPLAEAPRESAPPRPDPGSIDARRQRLQSLVVESTPPSPVQDAAYVDALRDEVSDTVVFGEAQSTAPATRVSADRPQTDTEPDNDPGTEPNDYRVQPGDSLWKIAESRLGDGHRWNEIYRANRERLRNVERLSIGQVIRIPAR